MTAKLTAIFFDQDTEESLLAAAKRRSPEELEKMREVIDTLSHLDDCGAEMIEPGEGEFSLVLKADPKGAPFIYPLLCNMREHTAIELSEISLDMIAQSGLFYTPQYLQASGEFDDSARDDAAEEVYENVCRDISELRAQNFMPMLAPYVVGNRAFSHELISALDLAAMDYTESLLEENVTISPDVVTAHKMTLQ